MRAALLVGILVLPALLAACTFPQGEDPNADALEPRFTGIPGLTGEPRSHPVALHVTADGSRAYVALAGTIARPDDRIAVVDLENGTLDDHIAVGRRPLAVVADPQEPDRLVVAHPYSPFLTLVDTGRGASAGVLEVPYYIEDLAFDPMGDRLVLVDRDEDRLLVYNVTRDDDTLALEGPTRLGTGPNPEHVVFVPPPANATWSDDRLVAVTDRHGASVTLADLETGSTRRLDTGGAPLAIAAHDGLVFVAGYAAGNGTGIDGPDGERVETATRSVDNSLLVLDLRAGPMTLTAGTEVLAHRYLSDTAHPARGHEQLRILAGASPRALQMDLPAPGTHNASMALWVAYHGTDQVQALHYRTPAAGTLGADVLTTRSGAAGVRLSHAEADDPLVPGRLGDAVHGVYETEPGPRALARHQDLLFVVAEFPETLQVVDLADCPGPSAPSTPCTTRSIPLVNDPRPWPDGPFEEGERLFYSAFPSADQDRSCASCHIDGLSSGGTVQVPPRDTPVRIPRLDQTADNAPWLLDGRVQVPADYLHAAGGDLLIADPGDPNDLASRDRFTPRADDDVRFPGLRARLEPLGANVTDATGYMDRTFAYVLGEERLLPAPPRLQGSSAAAGARIFESGATQCAACHGDGTTATVLRGDRAQDVPMPNGTNAIKAPALGGLWDRQNVGFLYDGRAQTLQEALLPDGHPCLRPGAEGLSDDWHGALGTRTCDSIRDLTRHLFAFDARR